MSLTEKERSQAWQGITKEEYKKYVSNPEAYFDALIKSDTLIEDAEHIKNLKYQVMRERDMKRLEALHEGPDFGTRVSWWAQKISDAIEKPFTWLREKSEYFMERRLPIVWWTGIALSLFGFFQAFWFDLHYVHSALAGGLPLAILVLAGLFGEDSSRSVRNTIYATTLWLSVFTMVFVFTPSIPAYLIIKQSGGAREVIVSRETWITRAPSLLAGDRVYAYKDGNSEIVKCDIDSRDESYQIRVIGKRNLLKDQVLPIIDQGIDYEFVLANFNHRMHASTLELVDIYKQTGRITQDEIVKFVEVTKNDLFFVTDVRVEVYEIGRDKFNEREYKRIF